eukprot:4833401-Amphidinium_carterae.1
MTWALAQETEIDAGKIEVQFGEHATDPYLHGGRSVRSIDEQPRSTQEGLGWKEMLLDSGAAISAFPRSIAPVSVYPIEQRI